MKKLMFVFAAIAVIFAVGCSENNGNAGEIDEDKSVVIIASNEVLTIGSDTYLADYMVALRDENKLDFEADDGQYGLFITSMNGVENKGTSTATSSEGYSWTVYIDFLSFGGVPYASDTVTCTYNGKTLYHAEYGVSAIPCLEGHTYAFVYEHYEFSW